MLNLVEEKWRKECFLIDKTPGLASFKIRALLDFSIIGQKFYQYGIDNTMPQVKVFIDMITKNFFFFCLKKIAAVTVSLTCHETQFPVAPGAQARC